MIFPLSIWVPIMYPAELATHVVGSVDASRFTLGVAFLGGSNNWQVAPKKDRGDPFGPENNDGFK